MVKSVCRIKKKVMSEVMKNLMILSVPAYLFRTYSCVHLFIALVNTIGIIFLINESMDRKSSRLLKSFLILSIPAYIFGTFSCVHLFMALVNTIGIIFLINKSMDRKSEMSELLMTEEVVDRDWNSSPYDKRYDSSKKIEDMDHIRRTKPTISTMIPLSKGFAARCDIR